jgi:hypothetical protein
MSRNTVANVASTETLTSLRSGLLRAGLLLAVATALTAFAVRVQAQSHRPIEIRPYVGALVPTGDQRDLLKDAVLVGGQAAYGLNSNFTVVGSFGWSPSEDKAVVVGKKVDLYQYDVGLEGRLSDLTAGSPVSTRPYATLGVGGRTYDYRNVSGADAQTNFLGYGAIGLDLAPQAGPLGFRVEARDNVSAFKGLRGELTERKARNDLQFSGGVTWRF